MNVDGKGGRIMALRGRRKRGGGGGRGGGSRKKSEVISVRRKNGQRAQVLFFLRI